MVIWVAIQVQQKLNNWNALCGMEVVKGASNAFAFTWINGSSIQKQIWQQCQCLGLEAAH